MPGTEPGDAHDWQDRSLPGRLRYLYVGSDDVEADLAFYNEVLGAELHWRFQAFGADVAAVRLGDGPLVLLADHRPAPSLLPIWEVADLDGALRWARSAGGATPPRRVETPDGPCLVVTDRSGNELGLLRSDRPDALSAEFARRGDRR